MALTHEPARPGTSVTVRAFHADGACYRWWRAVVERAAAGLVVGSLRAGGASARGAGRRPD